MVDITPRIGIDDDLAIDLDFIAVLVVNSRTEDFIVNSKLGIARFVEERHDNSGIRMPVCRAEKDDPLWDGRIEAVI